MRIAVTVLTSIADLWIGTLAVDRTLQVFCANVCNPTGLGGRVELRLVARCQPMTRMR